MIAGLQVYDALIALARLRRPVVVCKPREYGEALLYASYCRMGLTCEVLSKRAFQSLGPYDAGACFDIPTEIQVRTSARSRTLESIHERLDECAYLVGSVKNNDPHIDIGKFSGD